MIDYSNILQIDSIMDNAAFKMMLLSIRSDSNNNNLSLPSQSNVSTKEQPKSYDNNKIIIIKIKTTSYNNKIPL